ncbi:uncharacterized protein LOC124448847 [Xenia sp. Carnegie-2017]|uniref:uncharacterized protein LOC124448847 n=1 Tax=Xenia sp. Carnegie-2017 TaxID=2897299 RepID=UPI001F047B6D|nr:uncharacterized protein LOC124448847 [Xenia sp. Carnegie-2017]
MLVFIHCKIRASKLGSFKNANMDVSTKWITLEKALEGIQKKDKALYTQLLSLQKSVRELKSELKKERTECEEAYKDLERMSANDFEDDVFLDNKCVENENKYYQEKWKHDRQDSGISVKTPESDVSVTTPPSTHNFQLSLSQTKDTVSYPQFIDETDKISHNKQISDVSSQHNKEDSGVVLNEDALKDSKLLLNLVRSPEMTEKLQNSTFNGVNQIKWMKTRDGVFNHHNTTFSKLNAIYSDRHNTMTQGQQSARQALHRHSNTWCHSDFTKEEKLPGKIQSSKIQFLEMRSRSGNDFLIKRQPFQVLKPYEDDENQKTIHRHSNSWSPKESIHHSTKNEELPKISFLHSHLHSCPYNINWELLPKLKEKNRDKDLITSSVKQEKNVNVKSKHSYNPVLHVRTNSCPQTAVTKYEMKPLSHIHEQRKLKQMQTDKSFATISKNKNPVNHIKHFHTRSWPQKEDERLTSARSCPQKENETLTRARSCPQKENETLTRARSCPQKENETLTRARSCPQKENETLTYFLPQHREDDSYMKMKKTNINNGLESPNEDNDRKRFTSINKQKDFQTQNRHQLSKNEPTDYKNLYKLFLLK